jgi:hypothetical protein
MRSKHKDLQNQYVTDVPKIRANPYDWRMTAIYGHIPVSHPQSFPQDRWRNLGCAAAADYPYHHP